MKNRNRLTLMALGLLLVPALEASSFQWLKDKARAHPEATTLSFLGLLAGGFYINNHGGIKRFLQPFFTLGHSYLSNLCAGNRRAWAYTVAIFGAGLTIYNSNGSSGAHGHTPPAKSARTQPGMAPQGTEVVKPVQKPKPPVKQEEPADLGDCSLCLEPMDPKARNTVAVGDCFHVVHNECLALLEEDAKKKGVTLKCPQCRTPGIE